MKFVQRRDYYAGALMMLLGAGAAFVGSRYQIDSLARMGPGFSPTVFGVLSTQADARLKAELPHGETLVKAAGIEPQ